MDYSHSTFLVIFCLILVIIPIKASSQVHEFGFHVGQATLKRSPDFEYNIGNKSNTYRVLGIAYRFNMNNHFSIKASFNDFKLNYFESNDLEHDGTVLRSKNLELLGRLEYYLVPRQLLNWDIPQVRPFIYIGGGILRQKMPNSSSEPPKKIFYRAILNTGVGISVNATRLVNFRLEFGPRFTGVDNLDSFERSNMNDWYFIYGISTTFSIKSFPMVINGV